MAAPKPSKIICDAAGRCIGVKTINDDGNSSPPSTTPPPTPSNPAPVQDPKADPFKWCDKPRTFDEHNFCGLTKPTPSKGKDGKKAPNVSQIRQVVAKLRLPDSTPRLGPDPSVNEWNMLAVGYPIWLWTDQPNHLTTTAIHDGLAFTLDATRIGTTFTMGDGHTKTCAATSVYPGHTREPSPTCSYTYDTPSPVGHPYTITATNTWTIAWHTNGGHGTLTHTTTGTRTLDVGELQSLIRG
jgi:hypothetical protein